MTPFERRMLLSALYLALALAPLGVAALVDPIATPRPFLLELAVASGFVAFAVFACELALVSRLRLASEPFGTDALMMFHRKMGVLALGFALAHAIAAAPGEGRWRWFVPTSGPWASRCGAIALWSALILIGSSLFRRRARLRYETWRTLHRGLALALVAAMTAHMLAVSQYTRSSAVAATVWLYAAAFLGLLAGYTLLLPLLQLRKPWCVVENRDEGADTRTLVVEPVGHAGFDFAPGQFAWLVTGRSPFRREEHPISIASSAEPRGVRRLEFAIKALGDWSRDRVPRIAPGERVWVAGPFGAFTPDRAAGRGFALIAGGIGITPMRSMLLTLRDRGDSRPVVLFYAANRAERTVFRAEIERLERELDLHVVYVFESPGSDWGGERGYVTTDVLRRHLPVDLRHWQFFVCGPPPMLDAVERSLCELGISPQAIHSERFDVV